MEKILPVDADAQFENHIAEKDSYPFEFSHTSLWNTAAKDNNNTPLLQEVRQIRNTLEDIKGLLCEMAQPFEDVDK